MPDPKDSASSATPAAPQYRTFPIAQIKPSRSQARKDFDEPSLIELTQSMKEEGLIQAITVRLLPDGSAELVSGERRLRAAKRLGWTEIEAKVYPVLSDKDSAVKGMVENLQRADLNALERAQGYQKLVDEFHMSHDEIAKKLGMSNNVSVSRHLALLQMPKEIQDLLPRGSITERHARALRPIPDNAKQIELAIQGDKEGWTVKRMEQEVKKAVGEGKDSESADSERPSFKRPDPDPHHSLWQAVRDEIGSCCQETWKVDYNHILFADSKDWGWAFEMQNKGNTSPRRLSAWLKQVAHGIDVLIGDAPSALFPASPANPVPAGRAGRPQDSGVRKPTPSESMDALLDEDLEIDRRDAERVKNYMAAHPEAALWAPRTLQELMDMKASPINPRLPKTPQEWAEVEALAPQGPGAVYGWMVGPQSYWTKKAALFTWPMLLSGQPGAETLDPVTACHQHIERLRSQYEPKAPAPGPKPAPRVSPPSAAPIPAPETIEDPKIRAMIERAKARRKLL